MTSTRPSGTSKKPKSKATADGLKKRLSNLCSPWKRGESGNSAGRPRGARGRLTERFLEDLQALWLERGEEVLSNLLAKRPDIIFRAIVKLVPQQVNLSGDLGAPSTPEHRAAALMGAFRTLVEGGYLRADGGTVVAVRGANPAGSGGGAHGPIIDVPAISQTAGIPRGGEDVPGKIIDGQQPVPDV